MFKGAIIGFGKVAELGHLHGWDEIDGVQITAVADPTEARRAKAVELIPGVRTYESPEALLDAESLDFVDICTPSHLHVPIIRMGLTRGLHVLCEKPLTLSVDDHDEIRGLAEARGLAVCPVHNWKHAPVLAEALRQVTTGTLGEVSHVEYHTLRTKPAVGVTPWRAGLTGGGGGILVDHGWHGFYILANLIGGVPIAVTAWMDPDPSDGHSVEEIVHVLVEFDRGVGELYLTWHAPERLNFVRLYGSRGRLTLENQKLALGPAGQSVRSITFPSGINEGSYHPDWFAPVAMRFLEEIEDETVRGLGLAEAGMCVRLTELAYESRRRGSARVVYQAE